MSRRRALLTIGVCLVGLQFLLLAGCSPDESGSDPSGSVSPSVPGLPSSIPEDPTLGPVRDPSNTSVRPGCLATTPSSVGVGSLSSGSESRAGGEEFAAAVAQLQVFGQPPDEYLDYLSGISARELRQEVRDYLVNNNYVNHSIPISRLLPEAPAWLRSLSGVGEDGALRVEAELAGFVEDRDPFTEKSEFLPLVVRVDVVVEDGVWKLADFSPRASPEVRYKRPSLRLAEKLPGSGWRLCLPAM